MSDSEVKGAAHLDDIVATPEPHLGLGRAVRYLRKARGWDQQELAARSGVPLGTVSGIEGGQIDPRWSTVQGLCRGLEVTLGELAKHSIRLDPHGK